MASVYCVVWIPSNVSLPIPNQSSCASCANTSSPVVPEPPIRIGSCTAN